MEKEQIEEIKDALRTLFYELLAKLEPYFNGLAQTRFSNYRDRLEACFERMDDAIDKNGEEWLKSE